VALTNGGRLMMRTNVPVTEENRSRCRCAPGCMTYSTSELSGAVYCSSGASAEVVQMQGCKCPLCPVWGEYNLEKTYYCRI
jgi:hypothetical protein